MLSFIAPEHQDMQLIEAPQVVAPASAEDQYVARGFWDE